MKQNIILFKSIIITFLIISATLFSIQITKSVEPEEILQNHKLEMRARSISQNIRCVVCQNQSIDDSNAPLAKDLRLLIRNKISEGKSDEDIYQFLTDRYGDFILLKPALKRNTIVLWFLPFLFSFLGIYIVFLHNKKSKKL